MKVSKKTIVIVGLAILCVVGAVIALVSWSNKKQGIPARSLIQAVVQETALSERGAIAKQNLTSGFNGKVGTLLATQDMGIGYIPPPDESVMVFITGVDVERIERDAISWLMSRGFSESDLCYLPVVFSVVNPEAQTDKTYKLSANHVPEFCSKILGVE
ncbi:MAG: hypothetical protein A2Y84_01805 [Candidatus Colwellbacteria bacterium RBG_13_48_8]|uniref:Uncharacterized protein n=1 Tax=Candidatus Colwellbacteria bacterium RBG_13_48_8 TaxID=1797685 RepID=A0A1G1YX85_9BACT|nr:MAG: hypothetical protein A2Y84_01805 [Candidatus Colwellbacteria bacterium RBG_13_48_8]